MSPALRPLPEGPRPPSFARVQRDLDHIRDVCRDEGNRCGYFAAMYSRVTQAVQVRAEAGLFGDSTRMEVFVARFAHRYTEAFWSRASGRPTTQSWAIAFDAAEQSGPLVLQHLALGMNAHINLDLGIVAVEVAPSASSLQSLSSDFAAINTVLADLVDRCQAAVVATSPVLGVFDKMFATHDESAARFSLQVARAGAWRFAQSLALADPMQRPAVIEARDAAVAAVGRRLLTRAGPADVAQRVMRLSEWQPVETVIDVLSAVDVD